MSSSATAQSSSSAMLDRAREAWQLKEEQLNQAHTEHSSRLSLELSSVRQELQVRPRIACMIVHSESIRI